MYSLRIISSILILTLVFVFNLGCQSTDSKTEALEKKNTRLRAKVDSIERSKSAFQIVSEALSKDLSHLKATSTSSAQEICVILESKGDQILLNDFNQGMVLLDRLISHTDSLFELVVVESGGYNEFGGILNSRDKIAGSKILVEQGLGNEFKSLCEKVALEFESVVKRNNLNIDLSSLYIRRSDHHLEYNKTYAQYNFSKMPVGALEPIFMKYSNDFKNAQVRFINAFEEIIAN